MFNCDRCHGGFRHERWCIDMKSEINLLDLADYPRPSLPDPKKESK